MTTPPSPRHRVAPRVLLVVLLALVAATLSAAPGRAETSLGSLTIAPGRGTATQSNIRLATVSAVQPAGCPVGSTQAVPVVTGPGGWSGGLAFDPLSSLPTSGEIEVPLSPSFAAVAATAGTTIVPGRYDITLTCRNRLGTQVFGTFTGAVFFTDAENYQNTDPATTSTATSLVLTDDPGGRSELGAPVTLTAVITPATAEGTVEFVETDTGTRARLGLVPVSGGTAQLRLTKLVFGLHQLSARFVPTDAKRFGIALSPAPDIVHVVAKPVPPSVTRAPVALGARTIGATLACVATTTGAATTRWAWLRNGLPIAGQTARSHRVVAADAGRRLACRVTATNAGGQVSAVSAAVPVAAATNRPSSTSRTARDGQVIGAG